jgi:hypothetical protein
MIHRNVKRLEFATMLESESQSKFLRWELRILNFWVLSFGWKTSRILWWSKKSSEYWRKPTRASLPLAGLKANCWGHLREVRQSFEEIAVILEQSLYWVKGNQKQSVICLWIVVWFFYCILFADTFWFKECRTPAFYPLSDMRASVFFFNSSLRDLNLCPSEIIQSDDRLWPFIYRSQCIIAYLSKGQNVRSACSREVSITWKRLYQDCMIKSDLATSSRSESGNCRFFSKIFLNSRRNRICSFRTFKGERSNLNRRLSKYGTHRRIWLFWWDFSHFWVRQIDTLGSLL